MFMVCRLFDVCVDGQCLTEEGSRLGKREPTNEIDLDCYIAKHDSRQRRLLYILVHLVGFAYFLRLCV